MQTASRKAIPPIRFNRKTGELLLAAVILARSTSFLFSKMTLETLPPLNLLAVRFLLAFFFLALLFHKKLFPLRKDTVFPGMLLGALYFLVMAAELFSLKTTPSSTVSFLENTAVVIVPLLECIRFRRLPDLPSLFSIAAAILGISLLTLGASAASPFSGKLLALLAAILYAAAIIVTDHFARQTDAFALGILQVGFIGLFAFCASFLLEAPVLPATRTEWGAILMLALVCTCFGYTLQPVAQSHTTAARAGMLCALNPVGAALLGHVILREDFGLLGVAGAFCVLFGILLAVSRKKQ